MTPFGCHKQNWKYPTVSSKTRKHGWNLSWGLLQYIQLCKTSTNVETLWSLHCFHAGGVLKHSLEQWSLAYQPSLLQLHHQIEQSSHKHVMNGIWDLSWQIQTVVCRNFNCQRIILAAGLVVQTQNHLEWRCWKLFGKGRLLLKNTWQVMGWNICWFMSIMGWLQPVSSTIGDKCQWSLSVNQVLTKASPEKSETSSSVFFSPRKAHTAVFYFSFNQEILWCYHRIYT